MMLRNFITTIGLVFFSISIFSQDNYFWSQGKKINLKANNDLKIVYLKKGKKLQLNRMPGVIKELESSSKRLGNFNILKRLNGNGRLAVGNEVKAISNAFVTEEGNSLFPSPLVLMKLKEGYEVNDISNIIQGKAKFHSKNYNTIIFEVKDLNKVFSVANGIYESGLVEWCHPNFIHKFKSTSLPRDKQYYIDNKQHYCGAFDKDIDALEAWEITKGCSNIRVAILDTGVEDHPDLYDANGNSRVLNGYSVPNTTPNGRPKVGSGNGHGVACAGILAASHSNNLRGIAPNVLIVPINLNIEEVVSDMDMIDAINWSWEFLGGNADVLSNSWGTGVRGGLDAISDAFINAQIYGRGGNFHSGLPGLGTVVVFAAGNQGFDEVEHYAKSSIAVGAIDKNDTPGKGLDGFPNKRYTQTGPNLDLVAYGGSNERWNGPFDIRTIDRIGNNGYTSGSYNDEFGGTSAACPQVSGTAALILSINPNLTKAEVEYILFSTATDLGDPGRDNTYGFGKLNVYKACKAAVETRTNSFVQKDAYAQLSSFKTDDFTNFLASPGCGIAAGSYYCDVYKASVTVPSLKALYVGDGLSGATINTGEFFVDKSTNGNSTTFFTFFYYVKTNLNGQQINKWVPHDPYSNSNFRKVLYMPPADEITSEIVNNMTLKKIYATNSITLNPDFHARPGSEFLAQITSTSSDLYCLPNPTQSYVLRAKDEAVVDKEGNKGKIMTTNINMVSQNDDFVKIGPNPNNGNFKLNFSGEIIENSKISIYSLDGKLKYSSAITTNNQSVTFTSTPGIYFVKILNGGKNYSQRIILK